ncbi:type II toxin-antitoxin system RelE/ParE family toxin [Cellulomonas hominis]
MSTPQRRVVFRREALAQLDELYDFVAAAGSPVVAANLVDAIVGFCEDLAPFPLRGHARDDIRPGLRTIGFRRRAVVAFVVRDDAVVVLGVFYGGRDYEPILRGEDWGD